MSCWFEKQYFWSLINSILQRNSKTVIKHKSKSSPCTVRGWRGAPSTQKLLPGPGKARSGDPGERILETKGLRGSTPSCHSPRRSTLSHKSVCSVISSGNKPTAARTGKPDEVRLQHVARITQCHSKLAAQNGKVAASSPVPKASEEESHTPCGLLVSPDPPVLALSPCPLVPPCPQGLRTPLY